MAATDRKREGKYNQKRTSSFLVVPYTEAQIVGEGSIFATLPGRSLIIGVSSAVITASGTASSTIQPVVNGVNLGSALAVTAAGAATALTSAYLSTGGDVVIKAGTTAPATGSLVGELVIEYVELNKTNGEYTN